MNFTANYGGDPNYVGSTIRPMSFAQNGAGDRIERNGAALPTRTNGSHSNGIDGVAAARKQTTQWSEAPVAFSAEVTEKDYEQAAALWRDVFPKQHEAQARFVGNVAEHVSQVERGWLREEVYRK